MRQSENQAVVIPTQSYFQNKNNRAKERGGLLSRIRGRFAAGRRQASADKKEKTGRHLRLISFLAILLPFLCCGHSAFSAAPEKLVIISPHWEGIRDETISGFKAWHKKNGGGNVEITWLDQGGTSDDLKFIRAGYSRSPKGIDIDLFYGGGMDPYVELADAGLLVPFKLPDKALKSIPRELNGVPLYDSKYRWYGASLAGFGILYNKKLLKMYRLPEPKSWEDLAAPEYFGLVGSSDPRHSGSMHMMYEIILQAYGWNRGWEIITALGGNVRSFPKSASQINKDLSVGEIAAGLSIDTYAFSAIEEVGTKRLGFVLPQKATVITPDPIAILKGAPNRKTAEAFIRYVMSVDGQKLWMYRKGVAGGPKKVSLNKMSVMPSLYKDFRKKSNVQADPFKQKKGFTYNFKKGSTRWNLLNDMIGAFIIDTHDPLAAAWKKNGKNKKKRAAFLKAPVTEKEAMKLAEEKWEDQVFRNETINSWVAAAGKKYK